mmetsp:Transcript_23411/g.54484  ORF Transcript_23411/g.54484 Transcript_23411/m.54484 type:complete len:129 (+) Transcript_23411:91-477(+)
MSVWADRAGATTGAAMLNRHSRDAVKDPGFEANPVGTLHQGSAGKATGTRYEVVWRGQSSPFLSTSPFASNDAKWKRSTEHFNRGAKRGPRLNTMLLQDGELFEAHRHSAALNSAGGLLLAAKQPCSR